MKLTVCIGSSCHLKGSRKIVEELQYLIAENGLGEKVDLGGTFCMDNCQNGVCVSLVREPCFGKEEDEKVEIFSLTPETTKTFFDDVVLKAVK